MKQKISIKWTNMAILHSMLQYCNKDMMWLLLLLEMGARYDVSNVHGAYPLDVAVRHGDIFGVKLLLEYGRPKSLPIHWAVAMILAMLEVLCQFKYDLNQWDKDEKTPLHLAMYKEDFCSVRILLENGADPRALDGDGLCPEYLCNSPKVLVQVKELQ